MSEGPLRLAVLGDPLRFTLSPELHRAGLRAAGREGTSQALRVPAGEFADCLDRLEREGYRGVNVTHPHKRAALDAVSRAGAAARRALSVNTIGFGPGGRWGESTDGEGFLDFLRASGLEEAARRVLFLGAGGAVRALAVSLLDAGAERLAASCRRPDGAAGLKALDPRRVSVCAWRSPSEREAMAACTLIVNGTPLGASSEDVWPLPPEELPDSVAIVDLVYGPEPTRWVRSARARGLVAYDGLGMLVHQARRSLQLWLDAPVPLPALESAVGWPR